MNCVHQPFLFSANRNTCLWQHWRVTRIWAAFENFVEHLVKHMVIYQAFSGGDDLVFIALLNP